MALDRSIQEHLDTLLTRACPHNEQVRRGDWTAALSESSGWGPGSSWSWWKCLFAGVVTLGLVLGAWMDGSQIAWLLAMSLTGLGVVSWLSSWRESTRWRRHICTLTREHGLHSTQDLTGELVWVKLPRRYPDAGIAVSCHGLCLRTEEETHHLTVIYDGGMLEDFSFVGRVRLYHVHVPLWPSPEHPEGFFRRLVGLEVLG